MLPRHYPKAFGFELAKLIQDQTPPADLRNKRPLDLSLTDKELGDRMALGDCWWDADLPALYWYLKRLPSLRVPQSWEQVLAGFEKQLSQVLCSQ